jgi:hypothetical protein
MTQETNTPMHDQITGPLGGRPTTYFADGSDGRLYLTTKNTSGNISVARAKPTGAAVLTWGSGKRGRPQVVVALDPDERLALIDALLRVAS